MEKLLEDVSFEGSENPRVVEIDASYVDTQLDTLAKDEDLSRFIL